MSEKLPQVVTYARGTKEQLSNQFTKIINFIDGEYTLVRFIVDENKSANDFERIGLQEVLNNLNEIDYVIITDLSRLTRNIGDYQIILNTLKENGTELISIENGGVINEQY